MSNDQWIAVCILIMVLMVFAAFIPLALKLRRNMREMHDLIREIGEMKKEETEDVK